MDRKDELDALRAENARLKAEREAEAKRALHFKVGAKGGVSVYGLNARFPVTLYGDQWLRLLDSADALREFLTLHDGELSKKIPAA